MRKIACAVALALGTGCAVNTDPVLANADAGFPGSDAGLGPALTGFEAVMPYAGCDVDLACTEGCDEDLDCANAAGGELDERLAELDDATSMVMGEAAEAWLALGTPARSQGIEATVDAGVVILAAYDQADHLIARSTELPLLVVPAALADQVLRLRIVAMPGAEVDLARTWLP
ncbi:MAG: hypothetical protein R3F60_31345 [bacterium]